MYKAGVVLQPKVQKLLVQISGVKPAGQSPDHKTRYILIAEGVNLELEEIALETLFEPYVVEEKISEAEIKDEPVEVKKVIRKGKRIIVKKQ